MACLTKDSTQLVVTMHFSWSSYHMAFYFIDKDGEIRKMTTFTMEEKNVIITDVDIAAVKLTSTGQLDQFSFLLIRPK